MPGPRITGSGSHECEIVGERFRSTRWGSQGGYGVVCSCGYDTWTPDNPRPFAYYKDAERDRRHHFNTIDLVADLRQSIERAKAVVDERRS